MKKVSIVIPTYNEQENVKPISDAIIEILEKTGLLKKYDYEIIFIDNKSKDDTRKILKELAHKNTKIKLIFNTRNFGQNRSPYYGLLQSTGDCAILMSADFQDPVELIPQFIMEWENGYTIVSAIKATSKENPVIRMLRSAYNNIIHNMTDTEIIEHFTGFGVYDRSFIEFMKQLDDPTPFMRGVVAEYGSKRKEINFEQPKRRAGKSHNNFFTLYDIAMLSFTSYTKIGLRLATFIGFGIAFLSIIFAIVYLILKIIYWNTFAMGTAPMIIGMFFLGAVQLIFLGLIGEYVLSINQRIMHRPLVIEEERVNF